MLLNHIAIICSSEKGIEFYKNLGFEIKSYIDRGYDKLFYLTDGLTTLKIYVDSNHPPRNNNPECLGLRHLSFEVEGIEKFAKNGILI